MTDHEKLAAYLSDNEEALTRLEEFTLGAMKGILHSYDAEYPLSADQIDNITTNSFNVAMSVLTKLHSFHKE